MKKILLIGNYGNSKTTFGGQFTKTKNVKNYLEGIFGNQVVSINLYRYKFRFPIIVMKLVIFLFQSKSVVIMPAKNGLRTLLPLTTLFKKVIKYELFYIVIGGWLPDYLNTNNLLRHKISDLNGIFVETLSMKNQLEDMKVKNVFYVPNFTFRYNLFKEDSVKYNFDTIKMMTFSRVTKDKGITLAINAIKEYNLNNSIKIYIDIYGFLDPEYENEFQTLLEKNRDYIKYMGPISSDVIKTLSTYYAMVFPTFYEGEGFPGAVIESMIAGVPIIASNWKYNAEIIKNQYTGLIFDLNEEMGLYDCIKWSVENREVFLSFRRNCILEAEKFAPDNAMKLVVEMLSKNV